MAFEYNIHFSFESKEEIPLSLMQKRLLSEFTNLDSFSLSVNSSLTKFPEKVECYPRPADPNLAVPADHADAGRPEDHAEPELAAPAVPDAPVVADDTPAGRTDTPAAVTKEQLKEKLFELRDAKGSEAVKLVYAECGQGAKTLKTLDESLYGEVYARAVKYLAE
jgi:hypothetical protein